MAQTFSYTRLAMTGNNQPTNAASGVNPSARLIAKITGPASSVSTGMTIASITTDLATHIYGGKVIGTLAFADTDTYGVDIIPSSTYTAAACKIVVHRRSTHALLSSAVSLSTHSWIVELHGY